MSCRAPAAPTRPVESRRAAGAQVGELRLGMVEAALQGGIDLVDLQDREAAGEDSGAARPFPFLGRARTAWPWGGRPPAHLSFSSQSCDPRLKPDPLEAKGRRVSPPVGLGGCSTWRGGRQATALIHLKDGASRVGRPSRLPAKEIRSCSMRALITSSSVGRGHDGGRQKNRARTASPSARVR